MSFGSELKSLRTSKGIGVNELALHSGVSASQISRFENGKKSNPKPVTLQKLAKGLGVPASDLFKMAGIDITNSSKTEDPERIDLDEIRKDKRKTVFYQGREISDEDFKYMLRLLDGGKDDDD